MHLRETLPNSYWKNKLLDKQRLNDISGLPSYGIYNSKVLLQSLRLFTCLRNFSPLLFMTSCRMSSVMCLPTAVRKVCNAGPLPSQRSGASETTAVLLASLFIFTSRSAILNLFLPKFFDFPYLSVYVSDLPHPLFSNHFFLTFHVHLGLL